MTAAEVALTVDGIAVATADRLLVQNEATAAHNGIYTVTATGSGGAPYVLTRATDMTTGSQVPGAFCFCEQGTVNAGAGFVVASEGPFTIGTTSITWTQFSGAGEITAGAGLAKTGNTLSIGASPALTGTPTAPTASALTDNTQLATTAYADSAVAVETSRAETAEALKAPLASPALTGTPTAPTRSALTSNTDIATTAYADSAVGVETTRAEAAEALLAPLASPALTGNPTAPTKTALTSNTGVATTAYADSAVAVETSRAETAEALALPKSGGTMSGALVPAVVNLTDAATIAVNAALGNHFRVTLGGNRTIGAPSNPADGQKIVFEIIQNGTGSQTLAYNAAYAFSTQIPVPVLTTTAGKRDFLGFSYNATSALWYLIALVQGF